MQVTLQKPHEHAGEKKQPGDVLTLDDDLGEWLVGHRVAEKITPPNETTADAPADEPRRARKEKTHG